MELKQSVEYSLKTILDTGKTDFAIIIFQSGVAITEGTKVLELVGSLKKNTICPFSPILYRTFLDEIGKMVPETCSKLDSIFGELNEIIDKNHYQDKRERVDKSIDILITHKIIDDELRSKLVKVFQK